ncbi:hypothetical protein D3C78_1897860 [compost metagenome]
MIHVPERICVPDEAAAPEDETAEWRSPAGRTAGSDTPESTAVFLAESSRWPLPE